MYDNEDELDEPLSRIIHVTIINSLIPKTDIAQKILEKTSYEYKDRLKFNNITSTKDLYKPLSEEKENDKNKNENVTYEYEKGIIEGKTRNRNRKEERNKNDENKKDEGIKCTCILI